MGLFKGLFGRKSTTPEKDAVTDIGRKSTTPEEDAFLERRKIRKQEEERKEKEFVDKNIQIARTWTPYIDKFVNEIAKRLNASIKKKPESFARCLAGCHYSWYYTLSSSSDGRPTGFNEDIWFMWGTDRPATCSYLRTSRNFSSVDELFSLRDSVFEAMCERKYPK